MSNFPHTGKIVFILSILIGVAGLFLLSQRERLFGLRLANNQNELIDQLHQIMELPNEQPKITQIQEVNALNNTYPEVINDAKNGMIIISYPSQTILYDPSTRKIIKTVSYYLPQPLKLSVRYSPGEQQRAEEFSKDFNQATPLYKIIETTSSAQIYSGDISIINNEQRAEEIKIFNKLIGDGPLYSKKESSESASPADVFVIFGQIGKLKKK
jgi:hypothetical protein